MKKIFITLFLAIFTVSCSNNQTETIWENTAEVKKVSLTTTLPPLASIANYIGGDKVEVKSIVEPGFSPHTFDLKPSDMVAMNKSDILISTGLDIDNFIVENNTVKHHIQLKENVTLIEGHDHSHHEHWNHEDEHHDEHAHNDEHHHEEEHGHHHDEHHDEHGHDEYHHHEDEDHHNEEEHTENEIFYDPHVWLSFENAKIIAEVTKNKLATIDYINTQYYEDNYTNFIAKIDEIKANYLEKINGKKINHFVIFHDAYGYLFQELNIDSDYAIVLEDTAGREPSAAEMKTILDTITLNNITTLYKEPQFETKLIETLADQQSNLEVKILDPLWNSVDKNGYLDNIQKNLDNLLAIYE